MASGAERDIVIDVATGDILKFSADVVALKYAQARYGADAAAADALRSSGVRPDAISPRNGAYSIVEAAGALASRAVLFVGAPPLWEIDYRAVREIGRTSIAVLGRELPGASHVATTIHGPGFGLDEAEAALEQLRGVCSTLRAGEYPDRLERVTFVELNARRAGLLRRVFAEELGGKLTRKPPGGWRLRCPRPAAGGAVAAPPVPVTIEAELKRHVFVAMPFVEEMEDVFDLGIQPSVRDSGYLCERIKDTAFTGDILSRIKEKIETSVAVVADLTHANPNVYLEVGYAWGKGVPTILVVKDDAHLKFDVRSQRCLIYPRIAKLKEMLAQELEALKMQGVLRAR